MVPSRLQNRLTSHASQLRRLRASATSTCEDQINICIHCLKNCTNPVVREKAAKLPKDELKVNRRLRTHERMSLTPNLPQVWRREAPGRPQRSPCTGWRPSCSESCDGNWPEAGHCPSHSTIETCWSVLRHKGYCNVTISLLNIIAQLNQARINAQ